MDEMEKQRAARIVALLKEKYPEAVCALSFDGEPWKLLVMSRLSAQCTDKRVNEVSETLFERFPSARDLADAELADVEDIVRPCGLYHVKAKDIIAECAMLCDKYGGVLPSGMDELLEFPGVGRKIANLLRGDIFGLPAIVADTHCIRLSDRLGLAPGAGKNPLKVEKALCGIIEPEEQSDFCHRLIMLGREVCSAKNPRCGVCPLRGECPKAFGADLTEN